jgi:hypothetical protein
VARLTNPTEISDQVVAFGRDDVLNLIQTTDLPKLPRRAKSDCENVPSSTPEETSQTNQANQITREHLLVESGVDTRLIAQADSLIHSASNNSYSQISKLFNNDSYLSLEPPEKRAFLNYILSETHSVDIADGKIATRATECRNYLNRPPLQTFSEFEALLAEIHRRPFHQLRREVMFELRMLPTSHSENVDMLLGFFEENKDRWLIESITATLERIDPHHSAFKLLKGLQEGDDSKEVRSIILQNLEAGRIQLSQTGVRYLGQSYALNAEYLQEGFSVSRLNPDGLVGIFNKEKQLLGFFKLDLQDPKSAHNVDMLSKVSTEHLFHGTGEGTFSTAAAKAEYMHLFNRHFFAIFNRDFFQNTGVIVNNLSLQEQGAYIFFEASTDKLTAERAHNFIRRYGENGIRAFLSIHKNPTMGEAILSLGESLPPETAELLFLRYAQIVASTKEIKSFIRDKLGYEESSADNQSNVATDIILRKGQEILLEFHQRLAGLPKEKVNQLANQVVESLSRLDSATVMLGGAFKALNKDGKLTAKNFQSITLQICAPESLSFEEKKEMLSISKINCLQYPSHIAAQFHQNLEHALNDPRQRFYVLKYCEKILCFCRFEDVSPKLTYWGSFNMRPELKNLSFGASFMKDAIRQESAQHSIIASCWANTRMLHNYLALGFSIIPGGDEEVHKIFLTKGTMKD